MIAQVTIQFGDCYHCYFLELQVQLPSLGLLLLYLLILPPLLLLSPLLCMSTQSFHCVNLAGVANSCGIIFILQHRQFKVHIFLNKKLFLISYAVWLQSCCGNSREVQGYIFQFIYIQSILSC